MLTCDLHTHSSFSSCGVHSILEMLQFAIKKKLEAIAITDHGPKLRARIPVPFYDRFENPYKDQIRFFKGMECNFKKQVGEIDLPKKFVKDMDIVLLGFHNNVPLGLGVTHYTESLIKAVEENAILNVITHPLDNHYPMDYDEMAKACARTEVALELNNSKIELNLITSDQQRKLIEICLKHNCKMIVNSDAHVVTQLGNDEFIAPLLKEMNVPDEMIVNKTLKQTLHFLKKTS